MRNVRIYKDDIRQHILRSLFFTDTVLFVTGGLCIALILYLFLTYVAGYFSWDIYLTSLIVGEITFVAFITHKIDNQAIYKVMPRGVTYKTSKKELRQKEIESYFVDFSIQDNLIIRKNSIIKMYEVDPFDIALLNDQDREHFFMKLKQTIHILPSQVQFIVRKERTKMADYSKHLFSLYKSSNDKRESLIAQYSKDLSSLIDTTKFVSTHHYAVFSVPLSGSKSENKVNAIKKLNDLGVRFASSLTSCNISVRQLDNNELIEFAQTTLR